VLIEEYFRKKLGREVLYLPSARLALYLAFTEWFEPGDRLLMSSVTDDVVFFAVLAAGLVPLLAPVDPDTGNMDLAGVDEEAWGQVRGVMTSNLYGMPERMDVLEAACRKRGLVLLEDASHAIDSTYGGRPLGTFGTAAAFSFSKHLRSSGGVLAFEEASRRPSLERRAAGEMRPPPLRRALAVRARSVARSVLDLTHTRALGRRVGEKLGRPERRGNYRRPYEARDVLRAREEGAGLDRFERWVRVDNADYRTPPRAASVRTTLRLLEGFEANRQARLRGARSLLALGFTPRAYASLEQTAFLRIPLLVGARERVRSEFGRRGLGFQYIYDPPLDVYAAPPLVERLPQTRGAALWSQDVLPVNPLEADRFLSLLAGQPPLEHAFVSAEVPAHA
jgi:hypothetical protein